MRILKKGNNNTSTKSLDYTSLVRPILEYGAKCWDPYREVKINALDRVQSKAAKRQISKKCSFVNSTIQLWNQLPAGALGTFSYKPSNFKKRARKIINEAN
jgi:hypothetical protein